MTKAKIHLHSSCLLIMPNAHKQDDGVKGETEKQREGKHLQV